MIGKPGSMFLEKIRSASLSKPFSIIKSNRRKRERELISSVTSLSRGTNSELFLILQFLKSGIPPVTIFHDLIIKKKNNEFSQIDLVLVTSEGIIVIEVKDYSGWIYGSGNNTNWTKVLSYGKKKYKFYNPIKQNQNHIVQLRKKLKQFEKIPFFSVIIFFGDCELKEINYVPKGTYLVKSPRIFEVLNLIKKFVRYSANEKDYLSLESLAQVIHETALCGLGQTSMTSIISTMKFFKEDYQQRIKESLFKEEYYG